MRRVRGRANFGRLCCAVTYSYPFGGHSCCSCRWAGRGEHPSQLPGAPITLRQLGPGPGSFARVAGCQISFGVAKAEVDGLGLDLLLANGLVDLLLLGDGL